MNLTLADFPADVMTSPHQNSTPVFRIEIDGESLYAAFLYAEHKLYKVVVVDDSRNEASDVADYIAHKFASEDPEDFSTWIEQEFPEDVNEMSRQQVAQMFA